MGSTIHRAQESGGTLMKKQRIYLVLVGLFVIFLLTLIIRFITSSQITITIVSDVSLINTKVSVDGEVLAPTGEKGNIYKKSVGLGTHDVNVESAGYSSYKQEIKTGLKSSKEATVTLNKLSLDEIANTLYTPDETTSISSPVEYGNGRWITFYTYDKDGLGDGSIVIARFSVNVWETVYEGTDPNLEELKNEDAPEDLLISLREQ